MFWIEIVVGRLRTKANLVLFAIDVEIQLGRRIIDLVVQIESGQRIFIGYFIPLASVSAIGEPLNDLENSWSGRTLAICCPNCTWSLRPA